MSAQVEASQVIVHSVFAARAIAALAALRCRLPGPLRCELFERGIQDTYRLWAGDRVYALRVYKAGQRTQAQVAAELTAIERLVASGVSVAKSIPTSDGQLSFEVQAPEGIRHAAVFEWIPGDAPSYRDPAQMARMGAAAAHLHAASSDFDADLMAARSPIDAHYLLESPLELLRPFLREQAEAHDYFEGLAERLQSRLSELASHGLDSGLCHGDLHCGNARIVNETVTFFDLDFCGMGWRIFDLATVRWAARLRGVEHEAWEPFLHAYLRQRPIVQHELMALPSFILLRCLWLMGHVHARNAPVDGNAFAAPQYLKQAMKFCRALEPEAFTPAA